MYVSANQFYVFLACFSIGGFCGIYYSIFALIKHYIDNNVLRSVLDVILYLVCFCTFSCLGYILHFPSLRIFMLVGFFLGLFVYVKSLHIILANSIKKLYNKIVIKIKNKRKKVNTQDD